MGELYKITKAQADLIGYFEYEPHMAINPYCSEQKDGTFLVSEEMIQVLKSLGINKIDFSKLAKITLEQKDDKPEVK